MTQEQISRRTRDLCQDCWQDAHPTEYAPVATRYGPCAECGAEALVVRSRIADEVEDEITREGRALVATGTL
jgi:NMD protein affecting ribosome stability and mRNA decay